jgi:hypothetical protein
LWDVIYERRRDERQHLEAVSAAFASKDTCIDETASALAAFNQAAEEADHWLSPPTSASFAGLVEIPADKLARWAKSAQMWMVAEREALAQLIKWFFLFVNERARSLHEVEEDGDEGGISSGLERLFNAIQRGLVRASSSGRHWAKWRFLCRHFVVMDHVSGWSIRWVRLAHCRVTDFS